MPLTLVTGPANSAKAGWVLRAYRDALERARTEGPGRSPSRVAAMRDPVPEPLLVVPTAADVEPYQRELAASGTVFGGEVVTFSGLIRAMAERTGVAGRPIGPVARDRIVRSVVAGAGLQILAASASTPGFAVAAGRLFAELQRALVTPARLDAALAAWAAAGEGGSAVTERRRRYGKEVAGLYAAYRRRLEALGRHDPEGYAWAALDALRARPGVWSRRPVMFYGFDDLTGLQLDAVETLVRVAGSAVTVSLPYEAGRVAFAGRAAAVEVLRPLAEADGQVVELPDRSEHYASSARPALHHMERWLFEAGSERVAPNGAVRLLEAGGERAEAELVGATILELLAKGLAPADVAVLVRGPEAALVQSVLESYGIPVERPLRGRLGDHRLGAGLLAFARAALPGGTAGDLLRWLRTPGKLAGPEAADELEARCRRARADTAAGAQRLVAGDADLRALDALRAAAEQGLDPFLAVLEAELGAIWTAPHRRLGAVLDPAGEEDARVAAAVRAACGELRSLARDAPELAGGPVEAVEALAALEVSGTAGRRGGVLLADPMSVRARRYRAVAVCGLQDGVLPRRPAPDPFLDDGERRALAVASGLVLPLHEDALPGERYLFYATAARAEEVLLLSFRSADEEGEPQLPSPFVEDVRALFGDELWEGRGRRLLAEVTWPPAQAPTAAELRRAVAARSPGEEPGPLPAPAAPAVLAALAARECEPARGLETYAACGVRWLVESLLRPRRLDPDPEPLRRGSQAHAVLELALRRLRESTGSARLSPDRVDVALAAVQAALDELVPVPARAADRALRRGLAHDLRRWVETECAADTGMEPELLEWAFGGERDERPALALDADVRVSGRIDRVDVGPGSTALVRDYKGRSVAPVARWAEEGKLQAALYALAVRELLGLEPVGAVYQPIGAGDPRPRGAVRRGAVPEAGFVGKDLLEAAEWDAMLEEMRALATRAARDLRAGRIAPCPQRCTPRGCAHPGICRAADADADAEAEAAA